MVERDPSVTLLLTVVPMVVVTPEVVTCAQAKYRNQYDGGQPEFL